MNKSTGPSQAQSATQHSDTIASTGGVEEFHPSGVTELDLYQKREKIYTRKIEGFYQRIRFFTGWPLLMDILFYRGSIGTVSKRYYLICRVASFIFSQ